MNILFYSPVQLASGGGCERWHCDITNSLKTQFSCQVEIVTGSLGSSNWDTQYLNSQLRGIPYVKIKTINILGLNFPNFSGFMTLYSKLKHMDAVHFIYGFAGQDIIMWFLKKITGVKILVGHHAPTFHISKFHNWYMSHISRRFLNSFDYHQTLNAKDKQFFEQHWQIKNVHFIPSGIVIDKFLKIPRQSHPDLNFLTVGRFASQKGFDLLIAAIEIFNQKYPNNKTIFRLVGSGEHKELIDEFAGRNKNILNLGFIKYEQMPELYEKSDLYFLSSREEPFGLVLIESWSSGMPVVATPSEGPKDMLISGKNGWFTEGISTEAFANSLTKVYSKWQKQRDIFLKMEASCRQTGKKYSIDITAQKMMQLFKQ